MTDEENISEIVMSKLLHVQTTDGKTLKVIFTDVIQRDNEYITNFAKQTFKDQGMDVVRVLILEK